MNLQKARDLFIGAHDKVFLDSACVGLAPITAKEAIKSFLDMVVMCPAKDISEHHIAMDAMKHEAVVQAAIMLNTNAKNITLIENTTHGLNIAANVIPFDTTDEVIICNTEYLQVAIPFVKKHEAHKLKVISLNASIEGLFELSELEKKITKNTKAICISSVQWCTGQKIFSQELGEMCKNKGIWLIIDGVQEAGALNIDAQNRYCDFYIAGGHKWLNSPYGCGIMYMSEQAQKLEPTSFGYLNLLPPPQGWGKFFQDPAQTPFREYFFPEVAASFGIGGTGNYPGAIGLAEAIKIINAIGPDIVEKRILELTSFLRKELQKIGVKIMSSSKPKDLSGISIFRIFDSYEQDLQALNYLQENKIFLSIRYTNGHGGLRVSTHYYNTEEDILRLCHAVKLLKSKKSP